MRIQIGGEPSTLDPARVIDQYGYGILRNVVQGLMRLDRNGELEKGLAASYSISPDGLTYRFQLREDAKWSDGKLVTIKDCIFGLRHALDPKTASPNAEYLFAIKNARDVFAGKKPVSDLGVRQENDELVIELERTDPAFLLELTLPTASPAREDILKESGGKWNFRHPTTGDYIISAYRPSDTVELKPHPYNRIEGQRPVLFRILTEETTAMNLFEAGRMDVITTITSTEIPPLRQRGLIQTFPSTTVFLFSFNVTKPPFNDPQWRKAVSSVIDRKGLVKALNGVYDATTTYLPTTIEPKVRQPDLSFPDAVIAVKKKGSKPKVRIAFGASAFTKTVTEKVQYDLSTRLGLSVTLEPSELKTLLGRLKSDPPEMYFIGLSAVYDDPTNQLNSFTTATGPNFSRYDSPKYDRLINDLRTTLSPEKRSEIAVAANKLLVEDDTIVVPVVQRLQVFGVSKSLKGFAVSPYQVIMLRDLRK